MRFLPRRSSRSDSAGRHQRRKLHAMPCEPHHARGFHRFCPQHRQFRKQSSRICRAAIASAAIRERSSSITIATCSQIFSDRTAAACKWFAPTAIVRRRTPMRPWPYGDAKSQAGTSNRFARERPEKRGERRSAVASLHGAGNVRAHLRGLPRAAIRQTPYRRCAARHAGSDSPVYRREIAGVYRGASSGLARAARSEPRLAGKTDSRGLSIAHAAAMGRGTHRRRRTTSVAKDVQAMPHARCAGRRARCPESRRRTSPRATCRTPISITRSTALSTARVATPPQPPASKVPTCCCPASRRAAPATTPGTEAAESRCFECHTYHDPAQRKPAHSNFSLADLRGRTR